MVLTDLRSPNIDAPSECPPGATSSRMSGAARRVVRSVKISAAGSGVVIAATRLKASNALVCQPAPVAVHGFSGYFLSGLYG